MTKTFIDQMQREVDLSFPPKRIVSLVPSQTELIYDLGLEDRLVGLTKFCIHPEGLKKRKTIVGGTKNLDIEKIRALQPDLIIGNKEENQQDQIALLMKEFSVWMSDISDMKEALEMIAELGKVTEKEPTAQYLIADINSTFVNLLTDRKPKTVAYLIWREPYMIATGETFIDDMLRKAGFENVFKNETRYPEKTATELKAANPDLIFLSSEPYPFKEKHIEELKKICPESTITLVDGELFSWYGSRLLLSASYFAKLQDEFLAY